MTRKVHSKRVTAKPARLAKPEKPQVITVQLAEYLKNGSKYQKDMRNGRTVIVKDGPRILGSLSQGIRMSPSQREQLDAEIAEVEARERNHKFCPA